MDVRRNAREVRQAARTLCEYKAEVESQIVLLLKEFVVETGIEIKDLKLLFYERTLPSGSTISTPFSVCISLEFKK